MDMEPSEIEALVQQTAHEFANRVIAPQASDLDATERFPSDVLRGLSEIGLMSINVPHEYGGADAGAVAFALAVEQIARACASCAVMMSVTNMVGETIARFGTDGQKSRHLRKLASGEHVLGSFALSEPDAGSDPAGLRTMATRDGGDWILDGAKQWITGGGHAGVLLVWARTAPTAAGAKGLSCFLVEGSTPGLKVGRAEDKMGIRASNTVALQFDACRVSGDALLGDLNGGFRIAMAALDGGRIGIAAQALGIAGAALDESIAWAKTRSAFGVPIGQHQAIGGKISDMRTQIDAARLLMARAAFLKRAGQPYTREASMAKLFASEAAIRVCNEAVQIHGGYGYMREFAAERHLRDARVTTIYEGTSEIQRSVIARTLLL